MTNETSKVAIVTGASRGIGAAVANACPICASVGITRSSGFSRWRLFEAQK